jgi:lipopolysaccharide transport system permease protein
MATVLGAGLWLSALNVKYRDIVMLVPFITQVGLFLTPVVYPIDLIREQPNGENLVALYLANPAAGIVEMYRWMILPTEFPGMILLLPITVSIVLLVTGAIYFKRAERDFADVI